MSNTATDSAAEGNLLWHRSLRRQTYSAPQRRPEVSALHNSSRCRKSLNDAVTWQFRNRYLQFEISSLRHPVSGLRHSPARRVSRAELESRVELINPANPEVPLPLPAHLGGCDSCDDCQVSTTEIPQRFQLKGRPDGERGGKAAGSIR
jgi:hypothetical protein